MSRDDNTPTFKEVLEGDAPFPSHAFHNQDGMFVVPDTDPPTVKDDDMVKDDRSGLFLPRPTQKQVTRLHFDGGLVLEVTETRTVVNAAIEHALEGVGSIVFTAPVFNDPVEITRYALTKLMCITTEYRDLAELELAQRQRELNKRLAEAQLVQQRAALLNETARNHKGRR